MKKNSFRFDNEVLFIHTECGEYKFKIDSGTSLTKAEKIAELMVSEMDKVERKFQKTRKKTSPYAKLLLTNLNIADKYIQLERKYKQLILEREKLIAEAWGAKAPVRPLRPSAKENRSSSGLPPQDTASTLSSSPAVNAPADPVAFRKTQGTTDSIQPPHAQDVLQPDVSVQRSNVVANVSSEPVALRRAERTADPIEVPPFQATSQPVPPDVSTPTAAEKTRASSAPMILRKVERTTDPIQASTTKDTSPPALTAQPALADLVGVAKKLLPLPDPSPVPTNADRETEAETPFAESLRVEPLSTPASTIQPSPPALKITPPDRMASTDRQTVADDFELPYLDFLKTSDETVVLDHDAIRRDAEILEQKLGYFGIKGEVMEVSPGPVITTFEYKPAPGIKISKIVNLADDLALALSAISIRIVAPIPGKDVVGIEIPNPKMSIVPFVDIVGSDDFINISSPAPICLGKDIIGKPVVVGLEKMPHLLIAGATGTGKSVALNAMIASILYKSPPDRVKFIMIDPKRIELSLFNDIPHLLTPVIVDMKKANIALQWVVREMERRYENLAALQVRNIEQYNNKVKSAQRYGLTDEAFEIFPYIVVIIDELADLMMTASKDIEFSLTRIAQMARAAGIHLILATQRPSVDVLTGIIKANFPTRISFQVSSKTDSRTIIDSNGAETLLGRGDMLFVPPGTARLTRVHGTYLSEEELISITNFLKSQGKPEYVLDVISEKEDELEAVEISEDEYDEKYQAALEFVLSSKQASISSVQRALRVGYNRAARIIDLMEQKGIVSPADGIKPRQVLVDRRECLPY